MSAERKVADKGCRGSAKSSSWYERAQALSEGMTETEAVAAEESWDKWFEGGDLVRKPKHYTNGEGIECIKYIEQVLSPEQFIGFLRGNAIKYQHRCMYKGKPVEDLEKAEVYTKWLVQAMKGQKIDV